MQVGLKVLHPQQMCHTPSVIDINRVNIGDISLISSSHNISSSDLVQAPWRKFWFTCGKKDEFPAARVWTNLLQLGFPRKFDQCWLWSTHGPKRLKIGGDFDFGRLYTLAQEPRSKGWSKTELRWLSYCCPALNFMDNVDFFGVDFELTVWLFWGPLWHMLGWLTKDTFLVEASCWPP